MASSTITSPSNVVKGGIRYGLYPKEENTRNFIYTGLNATNNVIISAYESEPTAVGMVCNIGRINNQYAIFLYTSSGTEYKGAANIRVNYFSVE